MYIKWTFAAHHASLPDTASSHSTIASWNIMERDTPKVDSNQKKGTWSSNTCVCFSGMFLNFSVPSLKITARSWKMLLGSEKSFFVFGALSAYFCEGKLELVYTCFREVLFVSIFFYTENSTQLWKERTLHDSVVETVWHSFMSSVNLSRLCESWPLRHDLWRSGAKGDSMALLWKEKKQVTWFSCLLEKIFVGWGWMNLTGIF